MEKKAIILIGSPASGKDSIGKYISNTYNTKMFVMSEMIKDYIKHNSGDNNPIVKEMKNGVLLNDLSIFEIFQNIFNNNSENKTSPENLIILNGIPRSMNQFYWLDGFLNLNKFKKYYLFIDCSYKILKDRIIKRKNLENRVDDNLDIFNKRYQNFKNFENQLEPFKENFYIIDGNPTKREVKKSIRNLLDNLNF